MDFKESTITTYSGTSLETKPTIAAGTDVPNGSRWREIDTNKEYFFNLADDKWYLFEQSMATKDITSYSTFSLLGSILKELKIMNLHLSLITDTDIKKTEVE